MRFIKNDKLVGVEVPIQDALSKQHTICYELDPCALAHLLVKSDSIANEVTHFSPRLLSNALREVNRSNPARLGDPNQSRSAFECFIEVLRHLSSLSRTSLSLDEYDRILEYFCNNLLLLCCDWQ